MNIRTRLILNYSVISIFLLVGFSLTVLLFSINHRNNDFKNRLQSRAKSTVKLLIDVPQIDSTLLRIIDDNTLSTMSDFSLNIFDTSGKVLYSFSDNKKTDLSDKTVKSKLKFPKLNKQKISFHHNYLGIEYRVEASAIDLFGLNEISYLVNLLFLLLMAIFVFIIIIGIYNAYWSLKPFRNLLLEIERFDFNKKKLEVSGTDEVAQLSDKFNNLLDQLLKAYNDQKEFVSQVSHELRTPITALIGNIEITLRKDRTKEEYIKVLQSANEDGLKIAQIINGFLELAQANLNPESIPVTEVRVDELLFSLTEEFLESSIKNKISVNFVKTPDDFSQLTSIGNTRLLSIMFRNLIENALKYSNFKKVEINIDFSQYQIIVGIKDKGIGIDSNELIDIFTPMYRGQNVNPENEGHGLGLSIAQKIAKLHRTTIEISSILNIGTYVEIKLHRKV